MTLFPHLAHEHLIWALCQFLDGLREDSWLLQTPFHEPDNLCEATIYLRLQGIFQLFDPELTEFCIFLLTLLLFLPPPSLVPLSITLD